MKSSNESRRAAVAPARNGIDEANSLVAEQTGGASLDKVRDILFGVQMRDYDRRFARLEERLLKETADLKDEVRKRLDALDGYVKSETESLAEQIKAEREERRESIADGARELKDATRSLEKKASQLDELLARSQRD
jgi:hypothetical protein